MFNFRRYHHLGKQVIALSIALAMAPAAVATGGWQSEQQIAEQQYSEGNLEGACTHFVGALKGAQKSRVSSEDPTMRKMLYDDIPSVIMECVVRRQTANAKSLAQWKAYVTQQMYTADSTAYIDSEMDLVFVYGALHEQGAADQTKAEAKQHIQALASRDPRASLETARILLRKQQLMSGKLQASLMQIENMMPQRAQ